MEEVSLPLSAVIGAGLQCAQEEEISMVVQADVVASSSTSVPVCSESRDVVAACKEMETEDEGSSMFEPVGKGENLHYTLDASDGSLLDDASHPAALTPTSLVTHQEPTSTASLPSHSAVIGKCRAPLAGDPTKDYSLAPTTVQQSCSFPHAYTQQDPANSGINVTVEGQDLWEEFYKRGTEMIVNRAGRRMFPGFAVTVTGLKPKQKYTMKMEMVLADKHRFKFLNCQWIAVGNADPQPPSILCVHPDSPNSGSYWMRQGVSFRKTKITNNKDNPKGNVLLHSMHKYFLRLIIEEHKKGAPATATPKAILVRDFPETTFITVTAYQNEEVTQLKITNNPFAKAFREGAGQYDWDTLQMMYGPHSSAQGQPPALLQPSGINPPPPACYGVASPMTPNSYLSSPGWCGSPHPLAGQPHPLTPYPHMFNRESPGYGASLPSMFEWPTGQTMAGHDNRQLHSPLQSFPPPIHPSFIDPNKPTSAFPAFISSPSLMDSQGPVSTTPGSTSNTFNTAPSSRRLPQFNDFFGQPHAVGLTDEQHCF